MNNPNLGVGAALGIACLASCAAPMERKTVSMPYSSTQNETSLSNQVFREVNHYRQNKSRQELTLHTGLAGLARTHAEYLRRNRGEPGARKNDANHDGFGSRAMKAQFSMGFQQVAENVVACQGGTGSTYVRLWSQSPPHDRTMKDDYQYTGVGTVVDDDGMVFSVQLFGTKDRPYLMANSSFSTF